MEIDANRNYVDFNPILYILPLNLLRKIKTMHLMVFFIFNFILKSLATNSEILGEILGVP